MRLWEETPVEGLYAVADSNPLLSAILALGAIDSIAVDVFNINPRVDEAPEEARRFAHLLMQASQAEAKTRERLQCEAIQSIAEWRAKQNGRAN